jgi:hypothetical protein
MNKVRKINKFLTVAVFSASICASFSMIPAYATVATLSGLEISPANNGSYQITVKTDKAVSVEKYVTSGNKIILDLKNTRPASFVNTVYNNASKVDHVIVQPVSDEEVRIFIQGTSISDSKINVSTKTAPQNILEQTNIPANSDKNAVAPSETPDASTAPVPAPVVSQEPQTADDQQTIVLDRPVDNYKPVASIDEEEQQTLESPLESVQNEMGANLSLKSILSANAFDWILRFIMLAFIMIAAYKFFKPKKSIKIDISSERKRELDLLKTLNRRQATVGSGLKGSSNNLSRNNGSLSLSQYGMKEYQNSQLPPANLTLSRPTRKSDFNMPKPEIRSESLLKPSNIATMTKSSKVSSVAKISGNDIAAAKVNIDSKKFLETMAKIYERSGRVDLAQGIQDNMSKH